MPPEGHAGLKMALSGTFALVLLDVMLPGIDGYEICESDTHGRPRTADYPC